MRKLLYYIHTVKFLKLKQISFRILKYFIRPKVRNACLLKVEVSGSWVEQLLYERKFFSLNEVQFLNFRGYVSNSLDWSSFSRPKLWNYNLHYFDDLISFGAPERRDLQYQWINRWIIDNPAPNGDGWEPYPLSLRIVNWIKASLSGMELSDTVLASLAQQADFLSQKIEWHLMGNHLFSNAKALVFAGSFFADGKSKYWLKKGLSILDSELDEQILDDGGNFELTPMYHAVMLVDLLDLLNLTVVYPYFFSDDFVKKIKNKAILMLSWLEKMSHRDGRISFFNDAAFGIAPDNEIIFDYAKKLGLSWPSLDLDTNILHAYDLLDSGYFSVHSDQISFIADMARIGPDYIPGHAHADTLSFELCLGKQRFFVNSGISEYGNGKLRLNQRKTSSHNTVSVDGYDSSEVWGGFRVARRASIFNRKIEEKSDEVWEASCSHNGFVVQGISVVHARCWTISKSSLVIEDTLNGNFSFADAFFNLHPNVFWKIYSDNKILLSAGNYEVELLVYFGKIEMSPSKFYPQFGVSQDTSRLKISFRGPKLLIKIRWWKR